MRGYVRVCMWFMCMRVCARECKINVYVPSSMYILELTNSVLLKLHMSSLL